MKPGLVVVGVLLCAAQAWAEEAPPIVNIIPRYAAQGSAPMEVPGPEAQGSVGSLTDRQLPASKEFLLRYPASSDVELGVGSLEVWPEAEDARRADSVRSVQWGDARCSQPREDGKQTYLLGMVLKEDGGRKFLEAKVPALQVGQKFCFRVTPSFSLTASQAQALAVIATQELMHAFASSQETSCDGRDTEPFQLALVNALKSQGFTGNVFNVTQAAQLTQQSYVAALAGKPGSPCLEFTRMLHKEPSMSAMGEAHARVLAAEKTLAGLPLTQPALRSALEPFLNDPSTDLDATLAALSQQPASPERTQWLAALGELKAARRNRDAAEKAPEEYKAQLAAQGKVLRDLVLQAFSREEVRRSLVVSGSRSVLTPTAGIGTTPSKANFAALDIGAVFAFPGFDTWVLPYVGLNVYSAPVDRTIAPGELTGSTLQRLRQRVSLTLGATLTAPKAAGRTLDAPFLGRYPLVAAGYRFGEYTRLVAGSVFYNVNDPNPASADKRLHAAPFVGASLDADLVDILTKKL